MTNLKREKGYKVFECTDIQGGITLCYTTPFP